jgi:hypothetical protein
MGKDLDDNGPLINHTVKSEDGSVYHSSASPAQREFKTKIPEPRWQQVASVILILLIIAFFVAIGIHGKHSHS